MASNMHIGTEREKCGTEEHSICPSYGQEDVAYVVSREVVPRMFELSDSLEHLVLKV